MGSTKALYSLISDRLLTGSSLGGQTTVKVTRKILPGHSGAVNESRLFSPTPRAAPYHTPFVCGTKHSPRPAGRWEEEARVA